jgi:hypothetical protein
MFRKGSQDDPAVIRQRLPPKLRVPPGGGLGPP